MAFWNSLHDLFGQPVYRGNRKSSKSKRHRRPPSFQSQFEPLESRHLLSAVSGDFNGDGVADLAIGTPQLSVNGFSAGGVQIIYGTPHSGQFKLGLTAQKNQLLTRASLGLSLQNNDLFGDSLAVGDFNRDGIADLAIGAPGDTVNGATGAGAVYILFGSKTGLKTTGSQVWTQNSTGIADTAEAGDQFGAALAVGDFNGDRLPDLAVGVPNESVGTKANAGAVNIIYDTRTGLKSTNNKMFTQATTGMLGGITAGDLFGFSLAAGDFDANGFQDLAIGSPGPQSAVGSVNVLYGTRTGLQVVHNQVWTIGSGGVQGIASAGAAFGFSLAAGDFNGDSRADLAIGAPGENIAAASDGSAAAVSSAGAVHILFGSSARLTSSKNELWDENTTGIESTAADDNAFGFALAVGQFNTDHVADLAIGITGESVVVQTSSGPTTEDSAGAVRMLYGVRAMGLSATNTQIWDAATNGLVGGGNAGDNLGESLASGDFNGDGVSDLAMVAPHADLMVPSAADAHIIYGTTAGLDLGVSGNGAEVNQLWLEQNEQDGEAFLASNKTAAGVITLADGLQYQVLTPGSGATPKVTDKVTVDYVGRLLDNSVFDSSELEGGPQTFAVSGVIKGFGEVLQHMQVGEEVTVYIPSYLAYGMIGSPANQLTGVGIAPNSTIVFDITLDSIG